MNTEQEMRDAVVAVARLFPRETPAPGGAATVHQFGIDAGTIWALDKALRQLDDAIAEGRRSSDEQAEVVAWRYRHRYQTTDGERVWSKWLLMDHEPTGLDAEFETDRLVVASPSPAVAAGGVTEALNAAREWINAADHDEHCFTNDPNPDACRCVCDKDSVIALIDDVTASLAVGDEGMGNDR